MQGFDDTAARTAMRDYLALAGMVLHKRLVELGWQAPVAQRVTT